MKNRVIILDKWCSSKCQWQCERCPFKKEQKDKKVNSKTRKEYEHKKVREVSNRLGLALRNGGVEREMLLRQYNGYSEAGARWHFLYLYERKV